MSINSILNRNNVAIEEAKKQVAAAIKEEEAKKQEKTKKTKPLFSNKAEAKANTDEVELTSSKKTEEKTTSQKEKKGFWSKIKDTWNNIGKNKKTIKENAENAKNLEDFNKKEKEAIAKYCEILDKEINTNPNVLNELIENIEQLPERGQIAVINALSDEKNKEKVLPKTLDKLFSFLKQPNVNIYVKSFVVQKILNSTNKDLQKDALIEELQAGEIAEALYAAKKETSILQQATVENMCNVNPQDLGENGARTLMRCAAKCSHSHNKETEKKTQNIIGNSDLYKSSPAAQEEYCCSIKGCHHAESQTHATELVVNNLHTTKETITTTINEVKNFKKEAQADSVKTISKSDKVDTKQRQLLAQQLAYLHQDVQYEAARAFISETRNSQNADIMNTFANEIANLEISTDNKNDLLATLSEIKTVLAEVIVEVKAQIETQSQIQTKIQNINKTETQNKTNLVELLKAFGQNAINFIQKTSEKPTLHQFIDLLNEEVFTAEYVAKEGYKNVLISHFSSLKGDTQELVLKTLTVEDKILMRKKGLLPRRFWDNVDELIATKAIETQNISESDARLMIKVSSDAVLYKCLNKGNKLSTDSKNLFTQTLIDNRFLVKDNYGQYKLA